jgi:DNA-directed RNA polymerase specialized sigma24 family protein
LLTKGMDKLIVKLAAEWAESDIGLGEIVDRLRDLAARARIAAADPHALDAERVNPALRRARNYDGVIDPEAVREMRGRGMSYHAIALLYDCNEETVARYGRGQVARRRQATDPETIRALRLAGLSFDEIGRRLGCHADTARRRCPAIEPGAGERLGALAYETYRAAAEHPDDG